MTKLLTPAIALIVTSLVLTSGVALGNGNGKGAANGNASLQGQTQAGGGEGSNVSQAQLELMQKREEARMRRDALLKLRQQSVGNANVGVAPDAQTPQNAQ